MEVHRDGAAGGRFQLETTVADRQHELAAGAEEAIVDDADVERVFVAGCRRGLDVLGTHQQVQRRAEPALQLLGQALLQHRGLHPRGVDPGGDPLLGQRGATVTVTNVGTNAQRTTVTDGEGRFSPAFLTPGPYAVRAALPPIRVAVVTSPDLSESIVNEICGLGFTAAQWRKVGVAKRGFLDRLRERDPKVVMIFQEPEFLRWIIKPSTEVAVVTAV